MIATTLHPLPATSLGPPADELEEFQAATGGLNAEFSFSELQGREREVFDLFI